MPIVPDPRVPAGSGESFATTRWTVVLAARQMVTPEAGRALETLCRTYWMPLYAFLFSHWSPKRVRISKWRGRWA
jgi:hypothetical protein